MSSIWRIRHQRRCGCRYSDATQRSPLFVVAERLDSQVIAPLIANGAEVMVIDRHGRMPLDVAADSFSRTMMPLGSTSESVTRVLLRDIELGRTSVVHCLLQLGARSDWNSDQSVSPLNMSLRQGNFSITELLVTPGVSTVNRYPDSPTVASDWRDTLLLRAFEAARALKYHVLFNVAQTGDAHQMILPGCRSYACPIPSIMATLACIFGHAKIIEALVNQRYKLDAEYILWSVQALNQNVADRLFRRKLRRMFNTPDTALQLLLVIAKDFDRAEVEAALLNVIYIRLSHKYTTIKIHRHGTASIRWLPWCLNVKGPIHSFLEDE